MSGSSMAEGLSTSPRCGENDDIATISMLETDLELTPILYAEINEKIKAQFGD